MNALWELMVRVTPIIRWCGVDNFRRFERETKLSAVRFDILVAFISTSISWMNIMMFFSSARITQMILR